jgi:hypothetical protein
MREKLHIGADPGAAGAIVSTGQIEKVIRFSKLTDHEIWAEWVSLFTLAIHRDLEVQVILEKVMIRPTDGRSSGGKFMIKFGELRGMLIASGQRFIEVTPQTWYRKMGRVDPPKTASTIKKQRNCELAQTLFPQMKVIRETGDAFLLSEYGRRFHP